MHDKEYILDVGSIYAVIGNVVFYTDALLVRGRRQNNVKFIFIVKYLEVASFSCYPDIHAFQVLTNTGDVSYMNCEKYNWHNQLKKIC